MDILNNELVISRIAIAIFMPKDMGIPYQKDRPTHGFVFNVDCSATYLFDNGEELVCNSGELIYLPKGSNYTAKRSMLRDSGARGVYAINFGIQLEQNENKPCVISVRSKDTMCALFSRAAAAWRKKDVGYYEECMADLYSIIRLVRRECSDGLGGKLIDKRILPALEYIDRSFTNEVISVEHMAQLCKMSSPYLRRLFNRCFGTSVAVYIRNKRINLAMELLLTQEYSVTEVAMLSGFNAPSYFTREFKRATGVCPKEYVKIKRGSVLRNALCF